jgi:hypothetical protein
MPISNYNELFGLVKSLSKAEKRNFKLYSKRIGGDETMKFLQVFDALEKQSAPDEDVLFEKLKEIEKKHFSNVKRHLYKQILVSLRLIHIGKDTSIEVREHIDFARVLYGKGLYHQSLKILLRAKRIAESNDLDLVILEIIEFQKMIESRHITRTGAVKNVGLIEEAEEKFSSVHSAVRLSNLKILIHGWYIRHGHIKNEEDYQEVQKFFEDRLPPLKLEKMSFHEHVFLNQSFVWYYYIILDFVKCYEYAVKWVNLFKDNQRFLVWDVDLMLRGYHYVLTCAYYNRDKDNFYTYLVEFEAFRKSYYPKFNENSRIFSFIYVHSSRLNSYFLSGDFSEGIKVIPRTLRRIKRYDTMLDAHRIMVFYFKIAWMYLAAGQPGKAVNFLNKIFQIEIGVLREDIQGYSHLLFLMAHYDLDNFDIMNYLVQRTESMLNKMKDRSKLQEVSLKFFKKIQKKGPSDHRIILNELNQELLILKKDPYEKRAFLYLDIYSWVQSKIKRQPVSQIVKEMD